MTEKLKLGDWFFSYLPGVEGSESLCKVFNNSGQWRAEVVNGGWDYPIDKEGNCTLKSKKPGHGRKLLLICPENFRFGKAAFYGTEAYTKGMEHAFAWLAEQKQNGTISLEIPNE